MKVLVTGGAGFIGSHLVDSLVQDGHTVSVLDDFSTGSRANIPAGVRVIEGDVSIPGIYDALVSDIDACFHLAAIASVEKSVQDWFATHRVNAGGLVNLFDALGRAGKKIPVVFASSAAVYGDSDALPLTETLVPRPISAYGADKVACEVSGRIAADIHKIPNIGLRFFNVFGPRQNPASPYSGVVSIFVDRILKGQPIRIFGDGSDTRDFIYVADVVNALRRSLDVLIESDARHGVYNICTGQSSSVLVLAQTIAEVAQKPLHPENAAPRAGNIPHSCGNPSYAAQGIGFLSSVTLKDGLSRMIKT